MHDPACCPDCIHKQAELAQSQFVRMRSTKLEADLIKMKLEEYPYKKVRLYLCKCVYRFNNGHMLKTLELA